jgi:para-aminobenzoate synthetase/4-amino-4-deoxychorismate lyase
MTGRVVLQTQEGSRWWRFENPVEIIEATDISEVKNRIQEVEFKVKENHLYAAGFLCYEAAPAFDPVLEVNTPSEIPLLWFGLYDHPQEIRPARGNTSYTLSEWQPSISEAGYKRGLSTIHNEIALGNTYQVNFTFRQRAEFLGDPWGLFLDLNEAQQATYGAYIDCGRYVICSASPELFFSMNGPHLISRPMKGTVSRGLTQSNDLLQMEWLKNSAKNQAENVMIVDMIRNDLGRISRLGSVDVSKLFELERYPTIWQMTSTVESRSDAPFSEILGSLFPCASITGAPKVSTMNIIASMENSPRGVYTGCIGYLTPDRQGQFNVAIRTAVIDRATGTAEYGVGGGIVWDSKSDEEYTECLTKSLILKERRPQFQLLETMLWKPKSGYFLLEDHLKRLLDSATYFGYQVSILQIRRLLEQESSRFSKDPHKIRLLVDEEGQVNIESSPFILERRTRPLIVGLAKEPVQSQDLFFYHKTTNRQIYVQARAENPDWDDVIFWNERGEITESTIANVVIQLENDLVTPPIESGLLAGTYRNHLLEEGEIEERIIGLDDLHRCQALFLINSVRRWQSAEVMA